MNSGKFSGDERLSKFSNAGRFGYGASDIGNKPENPSPKPPIEEERFAELQQELYRSLEKSQRPEESGERNFAVQSDLPERLLHELQEASEGLWTSAQPEAPDAPSSLTLSRPDFTQPLKAVEAAGKRKGRPLDTARLSSKLKKLYASGHAATARAAAIVQSFPARGDIYPALRRRYLNGLVFVHRRVFDQKVEQVLFYKTPLVLDERTTGTTVKPEFVYRGPISRLPFGWAMSAAPANLKRFAFVDLNAGFGRTMLLASAHNFDLVAGHVYSADHYDALVMNLSQYPRSRMRCRDARAVRGDTEGIFIPQQPAVMFFPASLETSHVNLFLGQISTSLRLYPRPIYLIFEHLPPKTELLYMELFEKMPLPSLDRLKLAALNPSVVSVFRSLPIAS